MTRCARIRARVAACARREDGELLIEVLFSAMLVALISAAILNGYSSLAHLSGDQRKRVEANALAEQDQARLRGLTITQLASTGAGTGNYTSTQVIDGTTYNIKSTSQYITGSSAGSSCATGPTISSADEVATTSTVTWQSGATQNDARNPVVIHGLVTPSEGGSLIVTATTGTTGASGLAGVTATLTGPTTVSPLTTDANGCAIFGGLAGGSYTVAFTPPAGYIDYNGNTTVPNQTQTVVPTSTAQVTVPSLAAPGGISASFSSSYQSGGTTYNVAAGTQQSDQFIAFNQNMTGNRTYGTDSTSTNSAYQSTISTGNVLFPFAGTTASYSLYAGGCAGDIPPVGNLASAIVTSGTSASATIAEPAMLIYPWVNPTAFTLDDTASAALVYASPSTAWQNNTVAGDFGTGEHDSSTLNATATYTFYGTQVSIIGTKAKTNGEANVSIDGGAATLLNEYSSTTSRKQTVYTSPALTAGQHTLTVTVLNAKGNASGTGTAVSIDELTGTSVSLLGTAPNITVTDNNATCASNKDYPPEQAPTWPQGALKYPGEPYGSYTVCVDNGVGRNAASVANTNYTAGTVVNVPLYTGASGYTTGTCP